MKITAAILRGVRRREQAGSAVLIALAALGLLAVYLTANHLAVRELRQELKRIEQKQIKRLAPVAPVAPVAKEKAAAPRKS